MTDAAACFVCLSVCEETKWISVELFPQEPSDAAFEVVDEPDPTCAVCLDTVTWGNLALLKGCEHPYCLDCILDWARFKSAGDSRPVPCPCCKAPFEYVLSRRGLDGDIQPHLVEEPLVLLLRAPWFVKGKAPVRLCADSAGMGSFDDDYDDDYDEEERFLRERAGHRVRTQIVLGNRRFGSGGYLQSGRQRAVPRNSNGASGSGSVPVPGKGRGRSKGSFGSSPDGSFGSSPPTRKTSGGGPPPAGSSAPLGRRARARLKKEAREQQEARGPS